jgi:hypothetical protein
MYLSELSTCTGSSSSLWLPDVTVVSASVCRRSRRPNSVQAVCVSIPFPAPATVRGFHALATLTASARKTSTAEPEASTYPSAWV